VPNMTEKGLEEYRKKYEDAVSRPGKFEGEERYIPYFYDLLLDGGPDFEEGDVIGFNVTEEDVEYFHELKGRKKVEFIITNDGFVVEVNKPS